MSGWETSDVEPGANTLVAPFDARPARVAVLRGPQGTEVTIGTCALQR